MVEMGLFDKNYNYSIPRSASDWTKVGLFINNTQELIELKVQIENHLETLLVKDSNLLSFDFDAVMLITNSPAVTMTADGSAAADATFQEDLEKQRKSLEDSLSSFEYMPMAKVSLTYRF
jgi:hypothetical protein